MRPGWYWHPSRRTIAPVHGPARQRAHSGIEHQLRPVRAAARRRVPRSPDVVDAAGLDRGRSKVDRRTSTI